MNKPSGVLLGHPITYCIYTAGHVAAKKEAAKRLKVRSMENMV